MNALQKYVNKDYILVNSYLRNNTEHMNISDIHKSVQLINELDIYFNNHKIKSKYKFRVYRGIHNSKNKKYDFYTNTQKSYTFTTIYENVALNNYTSKNGYLLIIDVTPDIPHIIINMFDKKYDLFNDNIDEVLLPKGIQLKPTKIIGRNDIENKYSDIGITIIYCNVTM